MYKIIFTLTLTVLFITGCAHKSQQHYQDSSVKQKETPDYQRIQNDAQKAHKELGN